MPTPISAFVHVMFVGLAALFVAGCDASAAPNDRAANLSPPPPDKTGFAVVELFTSEGCSSCPPADALLADLAADARRKNQPVYCLAFHVDYWNHLGWADPFSDPAFSQRQRDYAAAFKTDEIYTPQMIVNGRTPFVGSNRAAATRAIQAALAKPAAATIDLNTTRSPDGQTLTANYHVHNAPAGSKLNLALVESDVKVNVPRGENAGRTLTHTNVVRAFKTVDVAADGVGRVDLPSAKNLMSNRVIMIAYVQLANQTIVGVADDRLGEKPSGK